MKNNRIIRYLSAFAIVLSIAAVIVGVFGFSLVSAESVSQDTYTFSDKGADTLYDGNGNQISGYTFCLNQDRGVPHRDNETYTRIRLSELDDSILSDYDKQLLLNLVYREDDVDDFRRSIGSGMYIMPQVWIWYVTEDPRDSEVNDPDSTYNTLVLPCFDYLMNNDTISFDTHDAYLYVPAGNHQYMLGNVYIKAPSSVTINKDVVDLAGKDDTYNGEDGTSGFTFELTVYDTLGTIYSSTNPLPRPVAYEQFTATVTDADGSSSDISVTTDSSGKITLQIKNDQSVTISGFDSANYSFELTETSDNMGNMCVLNDMTANVTMTSSNDVYSFDFSESNNVTVNAQNVHQVTLVDPTTSTSESTTVTSADIASDATTTTTTESTTISETTTTAAADDVASAGRNNETDTPTPTPASSTVSTGEAGMNIYTSLGIILILISGIVISIRNVRIREYT